MSNGSQIATSPLNLSPFSVKRWDLNKNLVFFGVFSWKRLRFTWYLPDSNQDCFFLSFNSNKDAFKVKKDGFGLEKAFLFKIFKFKNREIYRNPQIVAKN